LRAWLLCLIAVVLGACTGMQDASDAAQTLGPPLQRFSAEGRISVRQGERRDHLRFRWERSATAMSCCSLSPLGQGLAELARDAGGARLTQPNQAVIRADSLPQLAQRIFGAPLPLEDMADWLRGARPALSGEVDGWRVLVSETSAYRQHRLLRVIEARREDVEFKLVVDDWDVPE